MMKKITEYPHRFGAFLYLIGVFSVLPLCAIVVILFITSNGTQSRAAASDVPLLDSQNAVVIAERKVCTLVGANQTAVKIAGEDGGSSTKLGTNNFFAFGDTNLTTGIQLPNNSAVSTDQDASDCIQMTSKSTAGTAVPTLPKIAGECTVWPTDMVAAPDNKLHYFFSSLGSSCQIQHVGLAEMNTTTMDSTRAVPIFFNTQDVQIPNYKIFGASLTRQGTDVYVFWGAQSVSGAKDALLLAKVPASQITSKAAYTYWNGSSFQSNPSAMVPLWDQGDIGTNGMSIRFNSYLNKWTAIYNTGYVSVMSMRTADSVTGPWSGEQVIINCLQHFPLGSSANSYPCYGAKEYPHYQKNNGQTIYVVQSNTGEYKPFLHEITFGKEIHQLTDNSGNSLLRQKGDVPSGFTDNGVAFYASDVPFSGSTGIKEWVKGAEIVYSILSPGSGFVDSGIKFYASASKQYLSAPIAQWNKGAIHRYSALDLSMYGYTKVLQPTFYAKITNYRVTDDKINSRVASSFQIGVWKNNNWVQGGKVKSAKFSGLTAGTKYSPIINTPLLANTYMGQNLTADSLGSLTVNGNFSFVSFANLALFGENQQLNTTTNLYGYEIKENGGFPASVGHQINPYRRAGNFKNFFITSTATGADYDARVCSTDCGSGSTVWSGKVPNCGEDLTLTPTGGTKCAQLSEFTLGGFAPNTQYDLYYCNPSCEDSVVKIVYSKISDASGDIKYINLSLPTDTDNDGFTDTVETFIGTNPNAVCGLNGWPPDVDNDGAVSILDLTRVGNIFGAISTDANYNRRYDMDADSAISILDLTLIAKYFTRSCSNPVEIPVESRPDVNQFVPIQVPLGKFRADYFNNTDFTDKVLTREEDAAKIPGINAIGKVPVPELAADGLFSVKWEGKFNLTAGKYRFNANPSVDSVAAFVDGARVFQGTTVQNGLVNISAGEHTLRFEYSKTRADKGYSFTSNFFDRTVCYDLSGDSVVNSGDMGIFGAHFGIIGESPWDIDGNNVTNSLDQLKLSLKNGIKCPYPAPTPIPTPTPTPTPTPIAQACTINPGAVVKGGTINLTISGFIASNLAVSTIGAYGTPIYSLGTFSGTTATLTIPASAQNGLYRVRIGFADGTFLYCTPDLSIN